MKSFIESVAGEIAAHLSPEGATEEEISVAAGVVEKLIRDALLESGPVFE